ncbi:MAG: glycosyltransferase family 9 protein [Nitrospinae bacterium]|nr:glycosyltransferase family 9 protein [Nitrospinota bacterium]
MKNILILNLTRMGDLLQTTPLIAGLKKKYPDSKITLLANKNFADICIDIPFIDELYTFDIKQFAPKKTGEEPSLLEIYHYLEGLVDKMKEKRFDTVINLSHSKLSAIFTSLLNVPDVRGLTSTGYGHRVIRHPWLNYFCNIIFNRNYNRFNLVDIYMKSGDVQPFSKRLFLNRSDESEKFADEFLEKNGVNDGDILIGFQPASSRPDRRWSSDSFAKLGLELVRKYGAKIIIFGVPSEKDVGDEIQLKMDGRVINAVGKTSVRELSALLKRCHVLVTNDTGTMHIAAAVGAKVVALFFAHALAHETGPYGEGHIILQADISCSPCSHHTNCKNPVCKDYITVEDVLKAVSLIEGVKGARGQGIKDVIASRRRSNPFESSNPRILESYFKKVKPFYSAFDKDNMVEFLPLIKKTLDINDIVGNAYRTMWKRVLGDNGRLNISSHTNTEEILEESRGVAEKIKEHYDIKLNVITHLNNLPKMFNKVAQFGKDGVSITKDIIKEVSRVKFDAEYVKESGNKIDEIDKKINLLGLTEPAAGSIISMFKFAKENLQGDNILLLAEETLIIYTTLIIEANIMEQMLRLITINLQLTTDNRQLTAAKH